MLSKILVSLMLLPMSALAAGELPLRLDGLDQLHQPCHLIIESWSFDEGAPQSWEHIQATVRPSFMTTGNPSLVVTRGKQPNTLYGENDESRDQIALLLKGFSPTPQDVRVFLFQMPNPNGAGPLQWMCKILTGPLAWR